MSTGHPPLAMMLFKLITNIYTILILGSLLRLININQSFWLDESIQALTAQQSLNEIVFQNSADFHPPLSYILSHVWIQFGTSESWLRLLPVLFGVGTIYVVYLFGRRLVSEKVGLISALLLAIAPYHICYSQEFRMYSMVTFFVTLSMYFFSKLIDKKYTKSDLILFLISSIAILYTHYLAGVIFIVQMFFLLFFAREKISLFLKCYLLVSLGFLPWLPMLLEQLTAGVNADTFLPGWSQMLSLSFYTAIPLLFVKFILGRIDFANNFFYAIIILFSFSIFGLANFPVLNKLSKKNFSAEYKHLCLLLFWLIIPIILTFLISFKLPMFQPFRLLFILPAFLLLTGVGISLFKKYQKDVLGLVISIFIFGSLVFNLNSNYWREDWKGSVNYLMNSQTDQSLVITAWPEPFAPMNWYGYKLNMKGVLKEMPAKNEDVKESISSIKNFKQIYLVDYLSQLSDPDNLIEKELILAGFNLTETKDFRGVGFINLYEKETGLALNKK